MTKSLLELKFNPLYSHHLLTGRGKRESVAEWALTFCFVFVYICIFHNHHFYTVSTWSYALLDVSSNCNSMSPKYHRQPHFLCGPLPQAWFSSCVPCLGSFLTVLSAREMTIYIWVCIHIYMYKYMSPYMHLDIHLWTLSVMMMMMMKLTVMVDLLCEQFCAKYFIWVTMFIFTTHPNRN